MRILVIFLSLAFASVASAQTINLPSGKLFIGDGSGIAQPQSMSGDCTITAAGVVSCPGSTGAPIAPGQMMANTTGSAAPAVGTGLSNFLDYVLGNSVGRVLTRTTTAWLGVRGPINVMAFGAKCDSSTDDTAAFNAAAAAGAGYGATIIVPPGICLITNLATITANGIYFECSGADSTKILTTSATGDVFSWNGSIYGGIRNCTIAPTVTRTSGAAIRATNAGGLRIEHNTINGMYNAIVRTGYGEITHITKNIINSTALNGCGIVMTGNTGNIILTDNMIQNSPGPQPKCGINIGYANGIWLNGNDTYGVNEGLLINPQSGESAIHIFGNGNAWDSGSGNGLHISPAAGGWAGRMVFTNEWAATNSGAGVMLDGAGSILGVSFTNAAFYNNYQQGLKIANVNAYDIRVAASSISGNGLASIGNIDGINVAAGVSRFQFIGNRSGAMGGFSNTQRAGIRIESGASSGYIVSLNDTTINVSAGITDGGTGIKIVNDNM